MEFEHIGISVSDPHKMAQWYINNLGFKLKLKWGDDKEGAAFISDKSNKIMFELFSLPEVEKCKADLKNPLKIHLAFTTENIEEDMKKLTNNGASFVEECKRKGPGDKIFLVKDPWGNIIQLLQRKKDPF